MRLFHVGCSCTFDTPGAICVYALTRLFVSRSSNYTFLGGRSGGYTATVSEYTHVSEP